MPFRGDGKTLAEGKFGSWLLGRGDVDVALDGVKSLELETKTELSKKSTLFWVNAKVVTRDGKEIPLSQLPTKSANVLPTKSAGQDYFGGPIKIQGERYHEAIAAEPENDAKPGIVSVDLSGIGPPFGSRRPSAAITRWARRRSVAKCSPFAAKAPRRASSPSSEPYETKAVIKSVKADSADVVTVELNDGRTQRIEIGQLQGNGKAISVKLTEAHDGKTVREESAVGGAE